MQQHNPFLNVGRQPPSRDPIPIKVYGELEEFGIIIYHQSLLANAPQNKQRITLKTNTFRISLHKSVI